MCTHAKQRLEIPLQEILSTWISKFLVSDPKQTTAIDNVRIGMLLVNWQVLIYARDFGSNFGFDPIWIYKL